MVVNSVFFFLTLIPLLAIYLLSPRKRSRWSKMAVLLYSYFFYGMWNPAFLGLIVLSTMIDYVAARGIVAYPGRKKWFLLASLTTNLGLLGFFKYYGFFVHSAAWMLANFNVAWAPETMDILLPVGISFYTFQTLSYTIDVYRGEIEPEKSLLDVAFFVAFFPQLVAGPIVRARDFLPQLNIEPKITAEDVADGIFLILVGLFMKSVLADNVAGRVDDLFASWRSNGPTENWSAAMLFGVQIYGDFAGYSLIAIGLGRVMGFHIMRNFNAPYTAAGLSDFWQRWHISLSSWLRDYLYIPLGGNRKGKGRTYTNLMTTMVLGGLWHGASIMFVIWGAIHGGALVVERLIRRGLHWSPQSALGRRSLVAVGIAVTFLVVSITWLPFRARSIEQCLGMMRGLFVGPINLSGALLRDFAVVGVVFLAHGSTRFYSLHQHQRRSPFARFAACLVILLALYFAAGKGTEFIYFQF
jgi:alginate O-acetyltransferase complex protein AlgI